MGTAVHIDNSLFDLFAWTSSQQLKIWFGSLTVLKTTKADFQSLPIFWKKLTTRNMSVRLFPA
jgi:hypothetical protein